MKKVKENNWKTKNVGKNFKQTVTKPRNRKSPNAKGTTKRKQIKSNWTKKNKRKH